jgi:hypothetical protein
MTYSNKSFIALLFVLFLIITLSSAVVWRVIVIENATSKTIAAMSSNST